MEKSEAVRQRLRRKRRDGSGLAGNSMAEEKLKIRRARRSDAARIAELSGELGYPASTAEVQKRLRKLTPVSTHALIVAETAAAGVIGWVHVSVTPLVESDARAEINGLIVAEGQRSGGAGAKLLEAAEAWARSKGCRG